MNTSELSVVPLQQASLCVDCEMITPSQTNCLACGSVALMSLARTLNGGTCSKRPRRNVVAINDNYPRPSRLPAFKKDVPVATLNWKVGAYTFKEY